MNWSYMAGLFDGEGSVTLTKSTGWFIKPAVCIASNSENLRSQLRSFLNENGIKSTESRSRNPKGRSGRVNAYTWAGCKGLVEKLLEGGVIEKRPQLEIFLSAVRAWEERHAVPPHAYLIRMDGIRRQLHGFAKKGRKILIPWNPPEGRRETAMRRRGSASSGKGRPEQNLAQRPESASEPS